MTHSKEILRRPRKKSQRRAIKLKFEMRPLLRHLATGLYFQGGASWTDDSNEALVYRNVEAALEAAYSSSIDELELNLILFDDPRYTVRVKLRRPTREIALRDC